jgi:hypothetical protein
MDAAVEIGVAADRGRNMQRARRHRVQQPVRETAHAGGRVRAEQLRQPGAQRRALAGVEAEECVERRARSRFGGGGDGAVEQPGLERGRHVEHEITDGDAAARRAILPAEHAVRQVLDGEFGVAIGALDPAAPACVMRRVDHEENLFSMPSQHVS